MSVDEAKRQRNPFADLTICLIGSKASEKRGEIAAVQRECLSRDLRFGFRRICAGDQDARLKMSECGFAVFADGSAESVKLMWAAMDLGIVPIVKADCGLTDFVPRGNVWNSPSDVAQVIESLRVTPEAFQAAKEAVFACGQPVSNGSRYYERSRVRIGIVCDLFYWDSMKDAADFVYFTPSDWREQIECVDCFLYVTAWRGIHGEWPDLFHEDKPNRRILYEIIDACRKLGKPTLFYSKEDPPHYEESLNIARRCDHVFTTCAEIIPRYRKDCGHDRVRSLCFGINPVCHNPVGMRFRKRCSEVIFSGSWSVRYAQRCAELGAMFDGVLASGHKLRIIDRNYCRSEDAGFALPEKYRPYRCPSLDHDTLQSVHKTYDWAININTVQDSRTMFANRTYELQAAGNLLVSNFSLGVAEKFPGIFIVRSPEEVVRVLNGLKPLEIYERQIAGVRRVMTGETCHDRLAELLAPLGLTVAVPCRKVAVIVKAITPRLKEMFDRQSYSNKILVEASGAEKSVDDCDLIAFWGECISYGQHYLEDMINAFKYTDSDYVTKVPGREHVYVDRFGDKNRTVFWKKSFDFCRLLAHEGPMVRSRGYSIDPFNLDESGSASPEDGGISVVVPTWRENPYLDEAVQSVLQQNYRQGRIEVLISVNGGNRAYFDKLVAAYSDEPRVRVLITDRKGANAGRNLGISAARFPLLTFLDDDDRISSGFLDSLACGFGSADVDVCVGQVAEMSEQGPLPNIEYLKAFRKVGKGVFWDYRKMSTAFSSFPGKMYRTALFRTAFGLLDESEAHTEDVIFWAENIGKVTGSIYASDLEAGECYLRRVRPGSLSRPSQEDEYRFYITDRLHVVDRLSALLFDPRVPLMQKDFVLEKLHVQESFMLRYMAEHHKDGERARAEILAHENAFLNKSKFARRRAIAFCHNFSPFVDASAFVATKRLREIERLEGEPLRWHVISQDMSKVRTADETFHRYYAGQVLSRHTLLQEPSGFLPSLQVPYCNAAFGLAKDEEAEVIYSRSLFVGSHMAAYEYKRRHPKARWYAEFSDPTAYGVDNKPRVCKGTPDWFDVERMVYVLADRMIFTNANQMAFMLSYNPKPELNERIRQRTIILHHPVLPQAYCNLVQSDYPLAPEKVNIGYFGTFYVTRKADDMLRLLENPQVTLHVFTTKPEELRKQMEDYGDRIRVNATVCQLEMLNLGSRMDYLYLNDTEFPGPVNPFLPSKYADYLATGTPIIAKIQSGSTVAEDDRSGVIKVRELTPDFVAKLRKKPLSDSDSLGVSVVIPTWRRNETLADSVESVLSQDYPADRIRVFVCVNGGDESYRRELEQVYASEPRVSVLYTENAGPNAGRNLGLRAAETPLVMFLDDDDTLTSGYLREMAAGFRNPQVTVSFGRMIDQCANGDVEADTYINRALATAGAGETARYVKASSLLSTLCGKMYRTDFFRRTLGLLDEAERHTEDMLFWAERFDRLTGVLHFCDPKGPEAYVRHLTSNSLSRPSSDHAYAFYVTDRIRIIGRLETIYASARLPDHRKMLESKLRAQKRVMREYIEALPLDRRKQAETLLRK